MCGIAVSLETGPDGRSRPWARPIMRHRGPDGEGVLPLADGRAVFEHCRLAVIDPDNREADQPFTDPSGRWVLVYNGELFNFRELRADLERRGARFRTDSDTEVVLQSFILDGPEAFGRFRGMFALVVWDRERETLVAARDQIGVKPLYWSFAEGTFVAASELRTLMRHPALRPSLDPAGVVEYLAFGYTAGEQTLIDGVRSLPPGHLLRLREGRVDVAEYWDVLPAGAPVNGSAPEDELVELLDEVVGASLVSDVPVSLMLSGGLDSSTIATLAARRVGRGELTAYSVSFGLPTDEARTAARLSTELGLRHREIVLTEDVLKSDFDAWLDSIDAPSGNPTWVAVSHIARAVREDGTKVLLSGDGGDELFGGYSRWMTYLRFHEWVWRRTPGALRRLGGRGARPVFGGLAGDIARRARDGSELFVGSRPFHDDDLARLLGPAGREAAAAFPPERRVAALRERFDRGLPDGDYLAWMSYLSLKTSLVGDYLARLDKMAMGESVEGRVPLLDPVLARWTFGLDQGQKVGGFEQKALFRRAVGRLLPDYILRRPKQGFCPPVAGWATSLLAARVNGSSALTEQGYVAPDAIDRLRDRRSAGASFGLWTLGTLTAWCDRNLA